MKKGRLLVIDDNQDYIELLKEFFQTVPDIELVLEAFDGKSGISILQSHLEEVDIILLDLIMPHQDGLKVLEYIKDHQINIKVIVITSYSNQEMIHKVSSLGAYYFMIKPFDLEDLKDKIHMMMKEEERKPSIDLYHNNLQISVTRTLHELGVPSHIKGYQYIREGIILVYEDPKHLSMMKELYPMIAKNHTSTVKNVERNIRHAIEISWNRGDWELMEDLFGNSIDVDKAKPTNREFILTIADKLRLEFMKPFITNE